MLSIYIDKRVEKAKIPQNLVFWRAKHACKSIISIRTTNYTFFKKSLKIEGFKSFFFLLDKTYDFWTNFQSGQKERTGETEGTRQTGQTERKERKGRGERRARGIYPGEGVGEN